VVADDDGGRYREEGGVVIGSGSRVSRGSSAAVGICDIVVGCRGCGRADR